MAEGAKSARYNSGHPRERYQWQVSPKASRSHQRGEEMNEGRVLGSAFEPSNDGFVSDSGPVVGDRAWSTLDSFSVFPKLEFYSKADSALRLRPLVALADP